MTGDDFGRAAPDPDDRAEQRGDETVERERERAADARRAAIEAGRRKGGAAGAALAGAMLAMRDVLDGPKKEEIPIEVEASGEPHDVDRDGVRVDVDGVGVAAPALERREPVTAKRSSRRR